MKSINFYLKKKLLIKDESVMNLSEKYLVKAKNNLFTLKILFELQDNKEFREKLSIPENYSTYEWAVICGYYAMYSAALALVAKIGYRSKNHSSTILVLEEFFVKKKELDKESVNLLKNANIRKQEIDELSEAKHKREIAQYSITKETTKKIAEEIKKDAYDFVGKVEELIGA